MDHTRECWERREADPDTPCDCTPPQIPGAETGPVPRSRIEIQLLGEEMGILPGPNNPRRTDP